MDSSHFLLPLLLFFLLLLLLLSDSLSLAAFALLLRLAYIIYAFFFRLLVLLAFNSCVCGNVCVCVDVYESVRVYHIEKFSLQSAWYMRARKYAKKYATQKSLKCKVLTIGKFASRVHYAQPSSLLSPAPPSEYSQVLS